MVRRVRRILPPMLLTLVLLASMVPLPPAGSAPLPDLAGAPTLGVPAEALAGLGPGDLLRPAQGLLPRAPGTVSPVALAYGPIAMPPGWDMNRVLLDLSLPDGFLTQWRYRFVDLATQEEPTNMEVHIHHALWFRQAQAPAAAQDLFDFSNFLFGTGEERTEVDLGKVADAQPGGPRYGVALAEAEPTVLLAMLHNKEARPRAMLLLVEGTFVHGDDAAIRAATACDNLVPLPGEGCLAGAEFHGLAAQLWGATFDVPRQAAGSGVYRYPPSGLGVRFTAPWTGTLVGAAGHLHPNGMVTVIVNMGPAGSGCEADLDQDGFPGTTLLRSDKIDRDPLAWPHSEDFQMGLSQPGWRAPVVQGDRIAQFGLYRNKEFASPDAMTFAGALVDPQQAPPPRTGGCTAANMGARLVDDPLGDPRRSVANRAWIGPKLAVCGGAGPACEGDPTPPAARSLATSVLIAGFSYLPGDRQASSALGALPAVPQGQSLRFVNADSALLVRHTVTSCAWPCNGPYVANYPQWSGTFDSEEFLNADPFDGGLQGPQARPTWDTPADLPPGLYSYYCRLHPAMRGAFEVVPAA